MISYLKIAPLYDEAVKTVFFEDTPLKGYLFYAGGITIAVYLLSIIFCRHVEMTQAHKKECQDSDLYGLLIYYFVLICWVAYLYVGKYVYDAPGAGFYAFLIFMALNFLATIPAIFIQISSFDNQSEKLPTGDNLSFWGYLKRPKYWFLCISSFGVIGVCYSMNDYDAFTELTGDEGAASRIFWLSDILSRLIGALFAFMFARCINEYVWAILYSAFAFIGVILIFAMTLTDKVNRDPIYVWTSVVLLGVATGGWW